MGDLSRDDVLARIEEQKVQVKPVEIPEWDGTIYVRKLLIGDLRRVDALSNGSADTSSVTVNNLVLGVCNAEGEPLFTKADAKRLVDADLGVATRIAQAINDFNGTGEAQVQEAAEDFGEAQSDDSTSE